MNPTDNTNREISSPRGGWVGATLVIFGCILVSIAFFVPPTGVIDPTVLTAFGEILTFAGAVIGIDYHHRTAPSRPPRGEENKDYSC